MLSIQIPPAGTVDGYTCQENQADRPTTQDRGGHGGDHRRGDQRRADSIERAKHGQSLRVGRPQPFEGGFPVGWVGSPESSLGVKNQRTCVR